MNKFIVYIESLKNYERLKQNGWEIDRIDNNGDYDYGNLRIVPKSINLANTRRNKNFIAVSPDGFVYKDKSVHSFCKQYGVSLSMYSWLSGEYKSKAGWQAWYVDEE